MSLCRVIPGTNWDAKWRKRIEMWTNWCIHGTSVMPLLCNIYNYVLRYNISILFRYNISIRRAVMLMGWDSVEKHISEHAICVQDKRRHKMLVYLGCLWMKYIFLWTCQLSMSNVSTCKCSVVQPWVRRIKPLLSMIHCFFFIQIHVRLMNFGRWKHESFT